MKKEAGRKIVAERVGQDWLEDEGFAPCERRINKDYYEILVNIYNC